jgi:hypothetical protein
MILERPVLMSHRKDAATQRIFSKDFFAPLRLGGEAWNLRI